jgi:hypothetical protein
LKQISKMDNFQIRTNFKIRTNYELKWFKLKNVWVIQLSIKKENRKEKIRKEKTERK